MLSNEKTELRIKESEVNNSFGKRIRIQKEDDLILDEVSIVRICLDIDIQHEHLKQKHVPKSFFRNKDDGKEEINKVLDSIYALFSTIKLKRLCKQHHQYLKFMGFLPNKREKRDDVFSCPICHPSKGSNGQAKNLKQAMSERQPMEFCCFFILSLKFNFNKYDFPIFKMHVLYLNN